MGSYLGGLIIGRIFVSEILGAYFWEGFFFLGGGGVIIGILQYFFIVQLGQRTTIDRLEIEKLNHPCNSLAKVVYDIQHNNIQI